VWELVGCGGVEPPSPRPLSWRSPRNLNVFHRHHGDHGELVRGAEHFFRNGKLSMFGLEFGFCLLGLPCYPLPLVFRPVPGIQLGFVVLFDVHGVCSLRYCLRCLHKCIVRTPTLCGGKSSRQWSHAVTVKVVGSNPTLSIASLRLHATTTSTRLPLRMTTVLKW